MFEIRLAPSALRDIESILAWSEVQFGGRIRLRYQALLEQAAWDLAENPGRSGSMPLPEIANEVFAYHLRHSRNHVSSTVGRIRNPRHFLVYRMTNDGCLEISRVLHDIMDLQRHISFDDPSSSPDSI